MAQPPRARLFGQPTNGAISSLAYYQPPGESYAIIITATRISVPDGTPLLGTPVEPDELVSPTMSDILVGRDSAMTAALAWLQSQNR